MKHEVIAVNTNRHDFVHLIKGTVEKQGDRYIATSPNLYDNLIIKSGALFRVK